MSNIKLELTQEQAKLLKDLLALDMERIGFEDDEADTLDEIYENLRNLIQHS
jgi:hypothetical protein